MESDPNLLTLIATVGHLMTGVGTVVLIFLVVKTLRHMQVATKLTEIQTQFKYRPWIGPSNSIREIDNNEKSYRFEIPVKNFGDLPSANVIAMAIVSENLITREQLKTSQDVFNLGPILPGMEKRYWLHIDSNLIKNAISSKKIIYTGMYFGYEIARQKNGYGMISEFNPETKSFVHKEMWADTPGLE